VFLASPGRRGLRGHKGASRRCLGIPFAGRLDDIGEDGMSLVSNIINMYKAGDSHTEVLAASIRHHGSFYAIIGNRHGHHHSAV